ncbi:MAG: hypothetical protein EB060_10380 [Proteobacteria bacterium]|nr:hypothetical protein [Pseudomonadota bacterium]
MSLDLCHKTFAIAYADSMHVYLRSIQDLIDTAVDMTDRQMLEAIKRLMVEATKHADRYATVRSFEDKAGAA